MSIRADLKKLKTGNRDLRKFGLMVGGVFVLIGLLFFLRHKSSYPFFIGGGGILIIFGATWPRSEERRVGKECRSRWSPYH